MNIIKGNPSPKAEEKNFYEISSMFEFGTSPFVKQPVEKYIWTLFKKDKILGWKQVSNNLKYGEKVPYTFGEKVVGIPYKIEVHKEGKNLMNVTEKKFFANLIVTPRSSKEPAIGRVILLNRGKANVNKAKFNESLSAEARTSNLFGKEITFYLWEEGASESEKYKKPKTARVDKNGIAKVQFSLMEYATQPTIISFFTRDSNVTKKFFVTAQYENKTISNKASVEVSNSPTTTPKTTKQPESTVYSIIQNTTDIVADGLGKLGDLIMDQVKTTTQVNPQPGGQKRGDGKCSRCEDDITLLQIKQIFPSSAKNEKLAQQLIDELNSMKLKYGIDTCQKKAHMVTQMGSETEFRTLKEEIDGYSVSTLKSLFGYFKRHPDEAEKYQGKIHEIAIRAYGLRKVDKEKDIISCSVSNTKGCNDLGNETMEEGYTYLGRGLIQLTGKYQYTLINKAFQKAFPNQGNLIKNPELLEIPKYAVMSGLSYWINNNLNDKAEKGSDGSHVDSITKIINRNLDESHYKRRRDFFVKAKTVFKIDECQNKKTAAPVSETPSVTDKKMLSKYLSYNQAIKSDTATKYKLDNTPSEAEIKNLKYLAVNIYDKIYDEFDGKVKLTSVFRSEKVNKKVGGSSTSQHRFGQALDIQGKDGVTNKSIFKYVKENLDYHQIIWEYGSTSEPNWVHVGYKPSGNKKINTRAKKVNNKTVYITFDL